MPTLPFPNPNVKSYVGLLKVPSLTVSEPAGAWPRPDFVTTCTIKLLLSPYSGGARPCMISSDWMASGGSSFE